MRKWIVLLALVIASQPATAQLTPQQALASMTRGINLGNTLEPPFESGWNNGPAQEYYFDDYKAAGFSTVRVPVRWDEHTADSPPYAIDPTWMNRVEQVIDWGLERDLIIILNAHHEEWIKAGYADDGNRARFDSIWVQVADRFKNKSDSLLFEIINEPYGMTRQQVDDLNARVLPIIRESNPTRIVIYSGHEWSSASTYMQAAIPADDYLMGYYHSYDPWEFCGLANGSWGTESQKNSVRNQFEAVSNFATTNSMPTMISEFGAIHGGDYNSRMRVYAFYVEQALRNNIAFHAWDDGGDFRIYQRESRTWGEEKDILIHTQIDGPTNFVAQSVGDTMVTVTWENRIARNDSNTLQRKVLGGEYASIAELDKLASSYSDTTIAGGNTYLYRVIARYASGDDAYSYPYQVVVRPTQRSNYLGEPFAIPGVIQAEDYDVGGEGLTYHDTDPENVPAAYRLNEGVDVEARDDGGFHVGYVEPGEWMEYTVNVAEAGTYTITSHVASLDGNGRFVFKIGETSAGSPRVPDTNSWMTLATIDTEIELAAGEQVMRVTIFSLPFFNLDRFVIEKSSSTAVETEEIPTGLEIYPNPVASTLRISTPLLGQPASLEIVNVLGQIVIKRDIRADQTDVLVANLPSGVYFVRLTKEDEVLSVRRFVKR